MGKAFECDMLKTVNKGVPLTQVDIPISDNLILRVIPMVRVSKQKTVQGVLCEEAAEKIKAVVSKLAGKKIGKVNKK